MPVDRTVRMFAGAVNTYPSSPLRGCIAEEFYCPYEVAGVNGSFDVSRQGLKQVVNTDPGVTVRKAHTLVVEFIRDVYKSDQTPQVWGPSRLLDSDFFS